ncbi:autotransporter outer membrane beta-barrel domain-containing protein, partial [Salmonella enterica subsp. salamae]|nr:autotransporter outer membrane beta-barrel domain-containing protein [Salmonella enterica subsp. salamae]
ESVQAGELIKPYPESDSLPVTSFFTRKDNVSLIRHLHTVMNLPYVSFLSETNQLNKRLGDIRQLKGKSGFWIKSGSGHAGYEGMNLSWKTMQIGADKKLGNQVIGIMGSFTQGNAYGYGMSEEHNTSGAGMYWSAVSNHGLFVDVVGKWLNNRDTFHLPSEIMGTRMAKGSVILGGIQTGWHLNTNDDHFFVEPSVEFVSGHVSGFSLKGNDVNIRVTAHNMIYSKIGLDAGITWGTSEQEQTTLSGGIFKVNNLYATGNVELLDRVGGENAEWMSRSIREAERDNHYLSHLSLNTRLSPRWRIYAELESMSGGGIHHNRTGQVGVRYQF